MTDIKLYKFGIAVFIIIMAAAVKERNFELSLASKMFYTKFILNGKFLSISFLFQDMAPPFHRVYTILIIRVLDVQDTPPFFTGIPYRTTIKENVQIVSKFL